MNQEWEVVEQVINWYEQSNAYTIYDPLGKVKLFYAKERSNVCCRVLCGENRPFNIKISDTTGAKDRTMLVLKRRFRFCGWAIIPGCAHRVDVHYMIGPDGNAIGSTSSRTKIAQVRTPYGGGCLIPTYNIEDPSGEAMATISGPFCVVCEYCGSDFTIKDAKTRTEIGRIRKMAPDSLKKAGLELVTEADNFKIEFPSDLDPVTKMAIMGATLQIDFQFFEDQRGLCEGRCCDFYCCGWPIACTPKYCSCCSSKDKAAYNSKRKGNPDTDEMIR